MPYAGTGRPTNGSIAWESCRLLLPCRRAFAARLLARRSAGYILSYDAPGEAAMEHNHSPTAISRRLAGRPQQNYLRDWVYGGIDGAVTTFAVVAGVVGAG